MDEPQTPSFALRDYQSESIDRIFESWKKGDLNVLGVAAVGSGKTEVFLAAAERALQEHGYDKKVIVLAHTDELVTQPYNRVLKRQRLYGHFQGIRPSLVKAEQDDWTGNVIFTSVQSMSRDRRLKRLAEIKDNVVLMTVDEAHHFLLESQYAKVARVLGCIPIERSSGPMLYGCTATANRTDKIGLHNVFNKEIFRWDMRYLMERGFLCDIKARQVKTGVDISAVKITRGDFHQGQLTAALNTEQRNQQIVDIYKDNCNSEPMILFTSAVAHAKLLAEMFKAQGVAAEAIYGDLPKEQRDLYLEQFQNGQLKVLSNVSVLTEGFDAPHIKHVFMVSPTKSQTVYIQRVGRGTRLHDTKEYVTVWDFVDVTSKHAVVQVTDLFGLREYPKEKSLLAAIREQEAKDADVQARLEAIPLVDFEDIDIWNTDAMQDIKLQEFEEFRTDKHVWRYYTQEKPTIGRNSAGYPVYGQARKLYFTRLNETDVAVIRLTRNGDTLYYRADVMRDDGTVPMSVSFGDAFESQVQTIRNFESLYELTTPHFQPAPSFMAERKATERQLNFLNMLFKSLARQRKLKHFKLELLAQRMVGEEWAAAAVKGLRGDHVSDLIGVTQLLLVVQERDHAELTDLLDRYLGEVVDTLESPTVEIDMSDLFTDLVF